jgi:hypothetical protein
MAWSLIVHRFDLSSYQTFFLKDTIRVLSLRSYDLRHVIVIELVSNVSEKFHTYTLSVEVKRAVSVHSYTMLTTYTAHTM